MFAVIAFFTFVSDQAAFFSLRLFLIIADELDSVEYDAPCEATSESESRTSPTGVASSVSVADVVGGARILLLSIIFKFLLELSRHLSFPCFEFI